MVSRVFDGWFSLATSQTLVLAGLVVGDGPQDRQQQVLEKSFDDGERWLMSTKLLKRKSNGCAKAMQ